LEWAKRLDGGERVWAIESAGGLGYLLAQQLLAAGEEVVDIPATLASRVRLLGTGRSEKNDPNDARSVAIAALRAPELVPVRVEDHATVLRLLSRRNAELGSAYNKTACRFHALVADLVPGGIGKELVVSWARTLLDDLQPVGVVAGERHGLAVEMLDELDRLNTQRKATADRFAAYNGTAPIEWSSGTPQHPIRRLSRRGNRTLNHVIHIAAVTQIRHRHSPGRAFYDRKRDEGMTSRAAIRALKRRISNTIYRHLVADAARQG
jgi:transposase